MTLNLFNVVFYFYFNSNAIYSLHITRVFVRTYNTLGVPKSIIRNNIFIHFKVLDSDFELDIRAIQVLYSSLDLF